MNIDFRFAKMNPAFKFPNGDIAEQDTDVLARKADAIRDLMSNLDFDTKVEAEHRIAAIEEEIASRSPAPGCG